MFSLREHDHRDAALQVPPRKTGGGGIPLAMPRSSSSGLRRATSAHGQGDLRITVRASPSSTSPRASHSSSASHRLVFPVQGQGGLGASPFGGALLAQSDLVPRTDAPRNSPSLANTHANCHWLVLLTLEGDWALGRDPISQSL